MTHLKMRHQPPFSQLKGRRRRSPRKASFLKTTGVLGLTLCFSITSIAPVYAAPPTTVNTISTQTGMEQTRPPHSSWSFSFPRTTTLSLLKNTIKTAFFASAAGLYTYAFDRMMSAPGVLAAPDVKNMVPDQNLTLGQPLDLTLPQVFEGVSEGMYVTATLANGDPLPKELEFILKKPTSASSYNMSVGGHQRIRVRDDKAYVLNGTSGDGISLKILDVSNPSSVWLLGSYTPSSGDLLFDMTLDNNLTYLSSSERGVISAQNRINVVNGSNEIGSRVLGDAPNEIDDFVVIDGLMYVLFDGHLSILNVSDPENIANVSTTEAAGATRLAVADDFVYLGVDNNPSLSVYNVSIPSNPSLVSS